MAKGIACDVRQDKITESKSEIADARFWSWQTLYVRSQGGSNSLRWYFGFYISSEGVLVCWCA